MRIGLIGSHCTGKSTLASALKDVLPEYHLGAEFSREVVKSCGINFETTNATQWMFYRKYLDMLQSSQPKNLITSRTLIDLYAYHCYFYRRSEYEIEYDVLQQTLATLMQLRSWWGLYVYIPIEFDVTEENEFRVGQKSDHEYRFEIDHWIKRTLEICQIPYITVTGTTKNRVQQIMSTLCPKE